AGSRRAGDRRPTSSSTSSYPDPVQEPQAAHPPTAPHGSRSLTRRLSATRASRIVPQRRGGGTADEWWSTMSQPLVPFRIDEAIASRNRLRLPVLDVRERVVAAIDSRVAVHPNELITEADLVPRQRLEGRNEVLTKRGRSLANGRRQRSPQDGVGG